MRPLDRLSDYLGAVERRLRLLAVTRGIAAIAAAALIFTVVAVLVANYFAFSNGSVVSARLLLFFGIAFAIAAALVLPVIRLNRRRAAREAESRYPEFQERLLTFTERVEQNANDPFLPLLADDTLNVAQQAEPKQVAKTSWLFSFSSAAAVSALVLVWLALYGPGFLGYGTSLLWGGLPKGDMKPFYDIEVQPGNHTVKKRGTEIITARLRGFTAPKVRFFGKYASSSQWEPVEMRTQPDGTAYEFIIPGLLESMDYYVEAGGVHSKTYKLTVIDLPSVKSMTTTYHFPAWTGMKDATEKGGDLRAVEGTVADVVIETDKPLATGSLLLDDGTKLPLRAGPDGKLVAQVPIQKDGQYHVAAAENGEDVRLTEEYFIEAEKDRPPDVKITRPGRDFRASPIEEVTVTAEASDDFALKSVELHYSVNGGAEKTASILQTRDAKTSSGSYTIPLEDFKVVPGDIVSMYATAKDARNTTNTDIFFVEVQPFERNYSQSQQGGGGGGGGGQQEQDEISQRQKEIITATFNQLKGNGAKGTDAENADFLSQVQGKLRDQAKSLADRMRSRQLSDAGDSFKQFANYMEQAVANMGPAADKLKGANWKDALGPEQKALQNLERAEALRRDIQVAFGNNGGGGGGGGMQNGARDLEGLFDLELDTEKNQFESAQQMQQSADQQQAAIDDLLQKLDQLAKRQQELANQPRNQQELSEKRYQQEMLRREAEKLQQQLDQMTRQMQNQQSQQGQQSQSGQQSQGGQQSQSGQSGQSGQQQANGRPGQAGRSGGLDSQQLRQTVDRLQQALDNMRQAASSQQAGSPQSEADARRAAEQLKEAEGMLSGLLNRQSGNKVDDLARQAEDLAQRQQEFEGQLRRATMGQGQNGQQQQRGFGQSMAPQQAQQLSETRSKEVDDLKRLESQMQSTVRDLATTQPKASSKLRDALGEVQQQELPRDMERNMEYIRRGYSEYAVLSEPQITAGLATLRDQLKDVQRALAEGQDGKGTGAGDKEDKAVEQALSQVESLRQQIEQLQAAQNGQRGGQQGQNGQNGQQNGQNGQQNGQNGQQSGQQSGQNGGGGNQGGYQQGNLSRNGQQLSPGGPYGPNGNIYGYAGGLGPNTPLLPDGPVRAVRPGEFENQYRETLNTLQALQGQIQNDPNASKDLQNLIREMQRLNPWTYANDPELNARIQGDMTADLEKVELELRRKVDDANGGNIRSGGNMPVPQGFEQPVAEYFKKLSQSK
jgi:hypothetical protein